MNKLLEGSSYIEGKSLKAQMINGEEVQLTASGSISVEAMYSLESVISTETGNVHIGLMQGNTNVSLERNCYLFLTSYLSLDIQVAAGECGSPEISPLFVSVTEPSIPKAPEILSLWPSSIQVMTTTGDVSIRGLDGSFDVSVQKGNISLQINKVISSPSQPMSSALAAGGDIHATVDPEVGHS